MFSNSVTVSLTISYGKSPKLGVLGVLKLIFRTMNSTHLELSKNYRRVI